MSTAAPFTISNVMPVDAFIGGNGDVVLCQEWTSEKEESYTRILVPIDDAVSLANEILRLARVR
jgi:hypothetical protein